MQRKIKILFFCPFLGGGGAEMHLLRLLNGLDKNEFSISLALSRPGGNYESMLSDSVQVYYLTNKKSSTISLLASIKPLSNLINKEKPDFLFSIMDHTNIFAWLAKSKSQWKCRTIFNVQTSPKYAALINKRPLLYLRRYVLRFIYPRADMIITLSKGVEDELIKYIPSLKSKIITINNIGLSKDSKSFSDSHIDTTIPKSKALIIACGRLIPLKGFQFLIPAIKKIKERFSVELWILGDGPYKEELSLLIQKNELNDYVKLLGFKKNPSAYFSHAKLFVLSSLYEGFGNVIVEAMASKVPVLATDCPYGPGEIITHKVNGWLVKPGSIRELANGIIQALETNGEEHSKIIENGFKRSFDFDERIIIGKYREVFLSLS